MQRVFILIIIFVSFLGLTAQNHKEKYIPETDPVIMDKPEHGRR